MIVLNQIRTFFRQELVSTAQRLQGRSASSETRRISFFTSVKEINSSEKLRMKCYSNSTLKNKIKPILESSSLDDLKKALEKAAEQSEKMLSTRPYDYICERDPFAWSRFSKDFPNIPEPK